jgi:lysophospholipase L1-like esterase
MRTRSRSLILFLVGMVVVCVVAAFVWLRIARPVGIGRAGPDVPWQTFPRVWSKRPVLLVGLGDSVTAGFGARKGYPYFDRLLANPEDEFEEMAGINLKTVFPNLTATNLAISGSTSVEHVQRELPRLEIADSNVLGIVVLTTGGNDLIHNYGRTPPREGAMYGATWSEAQPWIQNFDQRLEGFIQTINGRFPGGCHIFLSNIYDPTDGMGDMRGGGLPDWPDGLKILSAYNEIIRSCARRHPNVHLVDLHGAFLGHGIHCAQFWTKHYDSKDPHYWYHINLEDPNERGYDAIRRLFLLEMTRVAATLDK